MGCGSSREQAPVAIREAGAVAVIAPSFARIFFRNAINVGLPVIECEGLTCSEGSSVIISLEEGWVETGGVRHPIRPPSQSGCRRFLRQAGSFPTGETNDLPGRVQDRRIGR